MNEIPHDKGHITDNKLQSLRVNINLVLLMLPGVKVTKMLYKSHKNRKTMKDQR